MTEVEPEFSAKPRPPELGDPADDLPDTIRIQPPYTWERRHDPATPRVIRVQGVTGGQVWVQLSGAPVREGLLAVTLLGDADVAAWPYQHHLEAGVAMKKLRGPLQRGTAVGEQRHERGDMDLEGAFREVKEP